MRKVDCATVFFYVGSAIVIGECEVDIVEVCDGYMTGKSVVGGNLYLRSVVMSHLHPWTSPLFSIDSN